MDADRLDIDLLDDVDPFEVAEQAAHLFKHPNLGIEDILDVWQSGHAVLSSDAPGRLVDVR